MVGFFVIVELPVCMNPKRQSKDGGPSQNVNSCI